MRTSQVWKTEGLRDFQNLLSTGYVIQSMNTEAAQPRITETDQSLIKAELGRLLAERKFAGAPQMSAFLRYIVNQTLQGNADRIKAYSVGVDALGKPDSFDAQNDPSVRVLALRLRKTLSSVYESGTAAYAIVELRVGTYVPDFYKAPLAMREFAPETAPGSREIHGVSSIDESCVADSSFVMSDNIAGQRDDACLPVFGNDRRSRIASSTAATFDTESSVVESTEEMTLTRGKRRDAGKLLMASVLVVAAGLWQFGGIRIVGAKPSDDTALAVMGSTVEANVSTRSLPEPQIESLPSLYYSAEINHQNTANLMSLLLSSRLVQAGSVKVIHAPAADFSDINIIGSYQLVVGQFTIEGRTRLEAQIVNMQTGQVLQSSTLSFTQDNGEFSPEEIASVELLAMDISSVDGPLYQDYCSYLHGPEYASCRHAR